MADEWSISVGNLASRAPRAPAAVSPAAEDPELPLEQLGSGYPDEEGALAWRSDGSYAIDFDLNLLASSSERMDAPTGWLDLLNVLGGTPGLPANPPDWGTYAARANSLRLYRPVVQEIDVMPGEQVKLLVGIYWPAAAAGATGVRLRVVDVGNGKGWDGSAWASGGVLDSQAVSDTWKDVAETIDADTTRTERTTYRVIIEPIASSFDATTYCYASTPTLIAAVSACGIIGHNLPADATVTLVPQGGGTTLTLTWEARGCYAVGAAGQLVQTWRLTIAMPSGIQPRPVLGEVWIGTPLTLLGGSPALPITLDEGDVGQVRMEGARGRIETDGGDVDPSADMMLNFAFEHAAYVQARDIARACMFGAEPILLLPTASFEGAGRIYHGRIDEKVSYSRISPGRSPGTDEIRQFGWRFVESPRARRA